MFILLSILVISFVAVMVFAVKTANKEDFYDTFFLYGDSITTKGSNSD